jgi:hypothetical protein
VLRLQVVGLQIFVRYGPGGRNPVMVPDFSKVFFAQTKKGGSVELGVSAYIVVGMRMKRLSVFVIPQLFGVVFCVHVDSLTVPIVFLTSNIVAPL